MPAAAAPGDVLRAVSGMADVEDSAGPSASTPTSSSWEGTADVVTPWTPEAAAGSLQETGAAMATGLATLQRAADRTPESIRRMPDSIHGLPASTPPTVQRTRAPQRGQGTQAVPARLWSPATGPTGQLTAAGETSWPAPAATDGELDLVRPVAVPTADATQVQREAAQSMSAAQPIAPVIAQPVPEVQRQEAPAPAASAPAAPASAPASQPPTATVSSESANAASGGATPQTEEELDVLAGRLYDHIAVRLRRELRMDRERTGLLTDLS
jgi:hypothetical protein